MDDFALARRMMVDGQLRTNDVTNPYLLGAFEEIPRERFAAADRAELAYLDLDLQVRAAGQGPARYLLKPQVLAKLLQAAEIAASDRALDIACATGYSTALLAQILTKVVAVEEEEELAQQAAANLAALNITNAVVRTAPLAAGAAADGPFDVILINGAVEFVPESLTAQMAEGGRLVCVLSRGPIGSGMVYRKSNTHVSGRAAFDATAPLLPAFTRERAFVF